MSPESHATLQAGRRTTIVSVTTNALLTLVKITIGLLSGSAALIADGVHSAADLVTDLFTYVMLRVSHEAPDASHPYGHGKFEAMGTFALSLLLAGVGGWIAYDALISLWYGEANTLSPLALGAAFFSILANEGLYHYCRYWGHKVNSRLIIANAWHHRTDSLSSVAAVIGIGASLIGYPMGDATAALIVAALLVHVAYSIGRSAFDELVDAAVDDEMLERMHTLLKDVPHAQGAHRLRARKLGGRVFVDVHVDVPTFISVSEGHAIAESVEHALENGIEDVQDVTVHVDPAAALSAPLPNNMLREKLYPLLEEEVAKIEKGLIFSTAYFHFLEEGVVADIMLKVSDRSPTETQLLALKDKLINELGLFSRVQFFIHLDV